MKLISLALLLLLVGCAQKKPTTLPAEPGTTVHNDARSFLKECSQIRVVNQDRWLLTCQKAPHEDRTEIYDWSFQTQKLKRVTYQDGQIWDIAPIDDNNFYYSSSYDEFKEQFVSILSGAQSGSDIYLKNRNETHFTRMTSEKGLEFSFFWFAPKHTLYYVLQTPEKAQIKSINSKRQSATYYTAAKKKVFNPIWVEKTKTLYWVEYNESEPTANIMFSVKSKKPTSLFQSASRIFQIGLHAKPDELLIGFATGVGIEIWSYNYATPCWKLAYRVSDPVSEFYVMNEKTLYTTVKNSLKEASFLTPDEVCHPSPPGLGVTTP